MSDDPPLLSREEAWAAWEPDDPEGCGDREAYVNAWDECSRWTATAMALVKRLGVYKCPTPDRCYVTDHHIIASTEPLAELCALLRRFEAAALDSTRAERAD